MNNDEHQEDEAAAAQGRVGADRMAAGLSCIPDPVRGDLDIVIELRGWKESALVVLNGIDFQEIGKLLKLTLGSAVGPKILPALRELMRCNCGSKFPNVHHASCPCASVPEK